jgi:hypothetical protein
LNEAPKLVVIDSNMARVALVTGLENRPEICNLEHES